MRASAWWWHCLVFSSCVTLEPSLPPLLFLFNIHKHFTQGNHMMSGGAAQNEMLQQRRKVRGEKWHEMQPVLLLIPQPKSFLSNVGYYFGKKWSGMCFIEDNLQVTQQTADWDESSAAEVWVQTVRHKYGGRIYGLLSWRKWSSPTECNQHTFVGKHTSSDMKKLEGKLVLVLK